MDSRILFFVSTAFLYIFFVFSKCRFSLRFRIPTHFVLAFFDFAFGRFDFAEKVLPKISDIWGSAWRISAYPPVVRISPFIHPKYAAEFNRLEWTTSSILFCEHNQIKSDFEENVGSVLTFDVSVSYLYLGSLVRKVLLEKYINQYPFHQDY